MGGNRVLQKRNRRSPLVGLIIITSRKKLLEPAPQLPAMNFRSGKPYSMREVINWHRMYYPNAKIGSLVRTYRAVRGLLNGALRYDGKTSKLDHALFVAGELARHGGNLHDIKAGLFHDSVEEDRITLLEILCRFGPKTAALVDIVTKPRLVNGIWVFANSPEFYTFEDEYSPEFYNQRAKIYYTRLRKELKALWLKFWDVVHNLYTMDSVWFWKAERNIKTMAEQILWIAPRILLEEEYKILAKELERWGFGIPKELLPKKASDYVVLLPSRGEIVRNELLPLPVPNGQRISVYLPEKRTGMFEIGIPFSMPAQPKLELIGLAFAGSVVSREKSIVPSGMAIHENMFKISGNGIGLDGIAHSVGIIYNECMAGI